MSVKNAVLLNLGKVFLAELGKNDALLDEFLEFAISKIPAISQTATPEEVRVAIKESVEAQQAIEALFQPDAVAGD